MDPQSAAKAGWFLAVALALTSLLSLAVASWRHKRDPSPETAQRVRSARIGVAFWMIVLLVVGGVHLYSIR